MYEYIVNLDRVVDGYTLDVVINLGFKIITKQRIRLANVDTPEIYRTKRSLEEYEKGIKAKLFIEKRLADNNNEMKINTYKSAGKYGRYLGVIWLKDSDISLNEELVIEGLAQRI